MTSLALSSSPPARSVSTISKVLRLSLGRLQPSTEQALSLSDSEKGILDSLLWLSSLSVTLLSPYKLFTHTTRARRASCVCFMCISVSCVQFECILVCPLCVLYMCTHHMHCTHICTHPLCIVCLHACVYICSLLALYMYAYVCSYCVLCTHICMRSLIHCVYYTCMHVCECVTIECAVHTCMFIACTEHVCMHIGVCLVYWGVYTHVCTIYTVHVGSCVCSHPCTSMAALLKQERQTPSPALGPTELPLSVSRPSASATRSAPERHTSQALCIRCED